MALRLKNGTATVIVNKIFERKEKSTAIFVKTAGSKINGEWVDDFSCYGQLCGKAHEKTHQIGDKAKISISDFTVYVKKDGNKQSAYITIWDFDVVESGVVEIAQANKDGWIIPNVADDLPFV